MTTATDPRETAGHAFTQKITALIGAHVPELDPAAIAAALETPADPNLGDYAFPCFPLARSRRKAPPAIAAEIAEQMAAAVANSELLEEVQAAGGYLNFRVHAARFAAQVIGDILGRGRDYGASQRGCGRTICLDYSSPNIAKMFHVGHLRSTLIGAALVRTFNHLGHPTVGINHIGDWGTQFGKLLVAFARWGDESRLKERPVEYLYELYVRFHQAADAEPELETQARDAFRRLEAGDAQARDLWQKFRDDSLEEFQRIYALLGVKFDSFAGEAFYEDKMQPVLDGLAAKGLSETSQDALIVNLSDLDLPPLMLRKKDEATLYSTRDLAAAVYRHDTYAFHKMLYVVGQAQELHFKQLFEVLRRMGYAWADDCEHVMFGWVKFKDQHLKSREGKVVLLDEVLNRSVELVARIIAERNPELEQKDEVAQTVGIGAVIFADLATRRIRDVNFDWDEVLSFDHGSGPYVMYTHARLSSILRKHSQPVSFDVAFERLRHPDERLVIQKLEALPRQLQTVADRREPSYLCSYLVELAAAVNTYVQKGAKDPSLRILTEDAEVTQARVTLVAATRQVIAIGLGLLGMGAPERM
jgi:arginyl-tRNA synthetase